MIPVLFSRFLSSRRNGSTATSISRCVLKNIDLSVRPKKSSLVPHIPSFIFLLFSLSCLWCLEASGSTQTRHGYRALSLFLSFSLSFSYTHTYTHACVCMCVYVCVCVFLTITLEYRFNLWNLWNLWNLLKSLLPSTLRNTRRKIWIFLHPDWLVIDFAFRFLHHSHLPPHCWIRGEYHVVTSMINDHPSINRWSSFEIDQRD